MSISIRADFPGGNILVREINDKKIMLSPDLRDTTTNWFYWYFEAKFSVPGTYEFYFDMASIGPSGPAISKDGGVNWYFGNDLKLPDEGFYYNCEQPETVRFSMAIPYLEAHWRQFAGRMKIATTELCRSRQNRSVELFRTGAGSRKVLLTVRHHCCEMAANYILEGMLENVLNHPLENLSLFVVPFVDKDGVENGDQGKNRSPHDHARDYGSNPIYPEIAAIMALVEKEQPEFILDLHCPWLRGSESNETFYVVGPPNPQLQLRVDDFSEFLEKNTANIPARYYKSDNIPFGTKWNTGGNYADGETLGHWAAKQPWSPFALSMENPYANARELIMTPQLWREFGHSLLQSFAEYLHLRLSYIFL